MIDLLGVFAAGLVTFVTPCVLPLVPVYLAALLGGDLRNIGQAPRGQILGRAGFFAVGFLLVFTLLGLTATTIGAYLADHRAVLQLVGAGLILVFGLKFLGVLRIPLLDRVARLDNPRLSSRFGHANALLMGIVFAAGWSPCVGPVLGSVLTYTASATADPWVGAGYLAVYGFGFAVPLLVTAALAEAGVRLLRRISPWLPRIERGIGVLMLIVVVAMVADVAPGLTVGGGATAVAADGGAGEADAHPAGPVMLAFVSHDCPVCRRMAPVMGAVGEQCAQHGVRTDVRDVTEPDNRHLAARFRLVGLPTFVFLDADGQEVARLVGEQTPAALRQGMAAARGVPCPRIGALPEALALPGVPRADSPSAACALSAAGPPDHVPAAAAGTSAVFPLDGATQGCVSPAENE